MICAELRAPVPPLGRMLERAVRENGYSLLAAGTVAGGHPQVEKDHLYCGALKQGILEFHSGLSSLQPLGGTAHRVYWSSTLDRPLYSL